MAGPLLARVENILLLLRQFKLGIRIHYITFLRLLGKLASISCVVPVGLLSLHPLPEVAEQIPPGCQAAQPSKALCVMAVPPCPCPVEEPSSHRLPRLWEGPWE